MATRTGKAGIINMKQPLFFLLTILLISPLAQAGSSVTADTALTELKAGNQRFVQNQLVSPRREQVQRIETFKNGQYPFCSILSCSDSRVPVEIIVDQGIGDVFNVRVAGNVADVDEIASVEYGVEHLSTPLLVVLGHERCGAVAATVNNEKVGGSLPFLIDKIRPAVEKAQLDHPHLSGNELISQATQENVWQAVEDLFEASSIIREHVKEGKLQVIGAIYQLESGKIEWLGQHPHQAMLVALESVPDHNAHW